MTITIDAGSFDLARSTQCGQAFRWQAIESARDDEFECVGVAGGRRVHARQQGTTLFLTCDADDSAFWSHYFALDRDYAPLEALLARDPIAAPCLESSRGIRIFRQEAFETLVSFILSANNNVKRISGIVERVAAAYGAPLDDDCFAFPGPEQLASANENDLRALGAGYRAPYVVATAQMICDGGGVAHLDAFRKLPFAEAERKLRAFPGVGPKVAACIMLFGLGFDEAYPVDVWIERASQTLYPGLNAKEAARAAAQRFGEWAGAAQQYLFHHFRSAGR